jgi:hypothetical protein
MTVEKYPSIICLIDLERWATIVMRWTAGNVARAFAMYGF